MSRTAHDSPKMIRETLCVAQSGISALMRGGEAGLEHHMERLGRLIDLMDLMRPVGNDGKHGSRHTPWCGCER